MDAEIPYEPSFSLGDAENWLALGTGALLLFIGASRRSAVGAWLAVSSAPLLYRGITGRWPSAFNAYGRVDDTRIALAGERGLHVRESIRLELPVQDAPAMYRTCRDKDDACIKVVMKPDSSTTHDAPSNSSHD